MMQNVLISWQRFCDTIILHTVTIFNSRHIWLGGLFMQFSLREFGHGSTMYVIFKKKHFWRHVRWMTLYWNELRKIFSMTKIVYKTAWTLLLLTLVLQILPRHATNRDHAPLDSKLPVVPELCNGTDTGPEVKVEFSSSVVEHG